MVEVNVTDEFTDWYRALTDSDSESVDFVVGLLQARGVLLDHPYCSGIKGTKSLRELRVQSGGRPLRIFYAFDAEREAWLLLGGDKTGDKRFYQRMIPHALRLWEEYQ